MEIDRNLAPPWARRVGYSNRNAERLRAKSSVKVKSEGRNPKAEARIALGLGFRSSNFGTRPSFGPRTSGFGLQSYLSPTLSSRGGRGGSSRASGGRLCQSERRIYPAFRWWGQVAPARTFLFNGTRNWNLIWRVFCSELLALGNGVSPIPPHPGPLPVGEGDTKPDFRLSGAPASS